MVGIISVVIGGHFGGGDHFDGGDHFGGGTSTCCKVDMNQNTDLYHLTDHTCISRINIFNHFQNVRKIF